MWRRTGLCIVGAIVLTMLAYLNKQDGTFQGLYGWLWLGLALVGFFFGSNVACFGKQISPKSQLLILVIAWAFTGAMLWGRGLNAQRWRQFLYGVFLGFLYWDGIGYGVGLLGGKNLA